MLRNQTLLGARAALPLFGARGAWVLTKALSRAFGQTDSRPVIIWNGPDHWLT
jgi:hypothetical protein